MDDYGSISDEAMPAASGTYVGEATRPLILVVAAHKLITVRGKPGMIVSDNDTELTSNAVLEWCGQPKQRTGFRAVQGSLVGGFAAAKRKGNGPPQPTQRWPLGKNDAGRPFRSGGWFEHDLGPTVVASVEVFEGVWRFFER